MGEWQQYTYPRSPCQDSDHPLFLAYMKSKEALLAEIEGVLAIVRQGLAMHGGNVEVTDVDPITGKVFVRLQGSCVGCPMSELTLKAGIEDTLISMIPEITEVINVDAVADEDDSCCLPADSTETAQPATKE